MKKISALALMLAAFGANAGTIDAKETPAVNTLKNAECGMIAGTNELQFTASKSVGVAYTCSTTAAAVNAGNTRGKFTYGGGTSGGGGVVKCAANDTPDVDTTVGHGGAPATATGNGCD